MVVSLMRTGSEQNMFCAFEHIQWNTVKARVTPWKKSFAHIGLFHKYNVTMHLYNRLVSHTFIPIVVFLAVFSPLIGCLSKAFILTLPPNPLHTHTTYTLTPGHTRLVHGPVWAQAPLGLINALSTGLPMGVHWHSTHSCTRHSALVYAHTRFHILRVQHESC